MRVSICCITFNHEKFIGEALEGFLMQDFEDFEIVISDDCSTDSTKDILISYQKQFPSKIKLLLNKRNIGVMPNFIQALKACSGEYIALCEGDDYWTNKLKLKTQVEFLDNNKEFIACFHPTYNYYQNKHTLVDGTRIFGRKSSFTLNDLLKSWYINTCSLVFRNELDILPGFFYNVYAGDQFLCFLLALKGKFYYIQEKMSVYRVHHSSVTFQVSQKNRKYELERYLYGLDELNKLTKNNFNRSINKRNRKEKLNYKLDTSKSKILKVYYAFMLLFVRENDFKDFRNHINNIFPQLYKFYPLKRIPSEI